ncbi:hypothetical protein AK812_SmicGene13846 [Symbiodinium microadriaticum]|uniref:BTB domain-containing protein n=1 Tax=Symbiodinium microadriaticum TaxID=2951 RepID=A0A1Q9E749_SYMMI|nr:hypothetical protein AK812_SmicGene13846 [Symbiodinium microadriaticum]
MASEEQPAKRPRAAPDLTIAVDDGELEVHSIILELASPVFAGMLNSDMKEGQGRKIYLPGKCKSELEAFYKALQLCTMAPLTLESAAILTRWADEYQVQALKDKCEAFLIWKAPVDGPALQFAAKYGLHKRIKQCLSAMKSKVQEHIQDLHVLTTKECQEYLPEFWPVICSQTGVVIDMPPAEHVASMWPFLVEAVRCKQQVTQLERVRRDLSSLPLDLYHTLPASNRADARGRDFVFQVFFASAMIAFLEAALATFDPSGDGEEWEQGLEKLDFTVGHDCQVLDKRQHHMLTLSDLLDYCKALIDVATEGLLHPSGAPGFAWRWSAVDDQLDAAERGLEAVLKLSATAKGQGKERARHLQQVKKQKELESPKNSEVDALRRDVDRLNQPLRLVLVGFVALGTLFDELSGSRQLKDFPKRAIPVFLKSLRDTIPPATWCAPTLPATGKRARDELAEQLQLTLGARAGPLATIAVGIRPPALALEECSTTDKCLGIYRQGEGASNFLMRLRPGSSGLQASRILTEVVGPYLREMEGCNMRTFLDRSIRGQWKGPAKGKGRGKGKQEKENNRADAAGPHGQCCHLGKAANIAPRLVPSRQMPLWISQPQLLFPARDKDGATCLSIAQVTNALRLALDRDPSPEEVTEQRLKEASGGQPTEKEIKKEAKKAAKSEAKVAGIVTKKEKQEATTTKVVTEELRVDLGRAPTRGEVAKKKLEVKRAVKIEVKKEAARQEKVKRDKKGDKKRSAKWYSMW